MSKVPRTRKAFKSAQGVLIFKIPNARSPAVARNNCVSVEKGPEELKEEA